MNLQQVREDVESAIRKAEMIIADHGETALDELIYYVIERCDYEDIRWDCAGEHADFLWVMQIIDYENGAAYRRDEIFKYENDEWVSYDEDEQSETE